jgi:6-phosphogluconolactonase
MFRIAVTSLAVFDADADGQLTHQAYASCAGTVPRNFALAPSEHFMLVANQYSGDVSVLPVRLGSEEVGAAVTRVMVPKASRVKFL